MMRSLLAAMVLSLAVAAQASAACGWFGTQIECNLGGTPVSLGTQTAAEPTGTGALPVHAFAGSGDLFGDRPAPRLFAIELQNYGARPGSCVRLGNETYCY
jgi:hypothetical protein